MWLRSGFRELSEVQSIESQGVSKANELNELSQCYTNQQHLPQVSIRSCRYGYSGLIFLGGV